VDGLVRFINAMGAGKLITLFAVLAGMVGFFFIVFSQISEPPMGLLYSELELGEAAEITDRLDALQVPYRLSQNGDAVFVPNNRITDLRVSLAGEGLGGSIVGYEIFDRSEGLGTTSFVQNINRIRAVEGELSRTISEIDSVSSARVHIVVPERGIFRQDERRPSASIVLKTRRGGLSPGQVRAIQHLAAAAVAGLDANAISIVDQSGTLLARGGGEDGAGGAGAGLAERQRAHENRLRMQIESLLENTVGVGKVRAEVSVQMNLSRITTNSESFDPDGQVIVSQSTVEESTSDQGASSSGAVSVGTNLPDANATESGAGGGPLNTTSRTQETVNFEVSRTVSTETVEAGEIQKITVAVLVDGNRTENADGSSTYTPRPPAELDQLAALVRSAVGYDADRGDDVNVINLEFAMTEDAAPLPEQFSIMGLDTNTLSTLLERIFWGIAGILVIFMVIRPLVGKVIAAIPEATPRQPMAVATQGAMAQLPSPSAGVTPELAAAAAAGDQQAMEIFRQAREQGGMAQNLGIESQIDVASIEGRVQDSALKKVGDIVMRHPDESAAIVRSWLYSD